MQIRRAVLKIDNASSECCCTPDAEHILKGSREFKRMVVGILYGLIIFELIAAILKSIAPHPDG
ncbi:unnamed protein product [Orchesella dallaii]|uniref:Uncharacterized protein n=1 Tax=Orchesella dallaii TaxID=48710 RepID=A0ABP1PIT9_9HEXA